jgi:DNA-binding transcriptional ArsR family regulator
MARDVLYIESVDQAGVMLKPRRIEMLRLMGEPRTCPGLAEIFEETPQKVYYHVKAMERAGLVERVGERQVRGAVEGFYQARARSYWLAPNLVRSLGGVTAGRDRASLAVLCAHAAQMLADTGRLAQTAAEGEHVPSLSLAAEIALPDVRRRNEFLTELNETFQRLTREYGSRNGDDAGENFRVTLTCYPRPGEEAA